MSRSLLLGAAGGLARETLDAVRAAGAHDVIGFLDDDPALHGSTIDGVPVLGGSAVVSDHPAASVVVCAGRGAARATIAARLTEHGVMANRYATVVHPSVTIGDTCRLGRGSILLAGCVLTADVAVGEHVVLMPRVVLTHDDVIEDFATICSGATLGGSVRVEEAAYLGMSAAVRERVVVGAGSTVGMGAVVLHDVPSGETWAGNPARRLREHDLGGPT